MAGSPVQDEPLSSYSDPVYDRLERIVSVLRRYWLLLVVAAILAVVAALVTDTVLSRSPEAESYHALDKARTQAGESIGKAMRLQDPEAKKKAMADAVQPLVLCVGNAAILPEFQVHAAIEAAECLLRAGNAVEAKGLATRATDIARNAGAQSTVLRLSAKNSLAACQEDLGEFDVAIATYTEVQNTSGNTHRLAASVAHLGSARCRLAMAEAAEAKASQADKDQKADEAKSLRDNARALRNDAKSSLELVHQTQEGQALGHLARFLLENLKRQHPDLAGQDAPVAPATSAEATTKPAPTVESAPQTTKVATEPAKATESAIKAETPAKVTEPTKTAAPAKGTVPAQTTEPAKTVAEPPAKAPAADTTKTSAPLDAGAKSERAPKAGPKSTEP